MLNRRSFLTGLAAGAVVAGFDPRSRRWLSGAEAAEGRGSPIPPLDGQLLTDPSSLAADATDAGGIVHQTPWAILRPGSTEDVARMIRFCRQHDLKVAGRGQGHTLFGQSQVDGGLVIETATLNDVGPLQGDQIEVGAGVKWSDLVPYTAAQGLAPPVLTGFLGLSVGGTLSVGGVGVANRSGVQVDNVLALEVVTGEGRVQRCSPDQHRSLFDAALAGVGQFGIITRARVRLVAAPPRARQYILLYFDPAGMFADMRAHLEGRRFDGVWGGAAALPTGGFIYQLNLVKYYDPSSTPDDAALLGSDNHDIEAQRQINDQTYTEFQLRVDFLVAFLKSVGLWDGVAHPWLDLFLPGDKAESFISETMSHLSFDDLGAFGLVQIFPLERAKMGQPSFRVPETEWVYLFDILTSAPGPGPNPAFVEAKVQRNRTLFEQARAIGGTLYPISAVPMSPFDWAQQYGSRYWELLKLKTKYDPDRILTPGPNIFFSR